MVLQSPADDQAITLPRGASRVLKFPVKDGSGNNVALPDATAKWWVATVQDAPSSAQKLVEKESGSGLVISELGGLYTIEVTLTSLDTEDIDPGYYYHELHLTDTLGNELPVSRGPFTLEEAMID